MKSTSSVIFALLAGAAAGAVLGLLIAPESGEETRKKLAKSAQKFNENLKTSMNDLAVKGQQALKDITETVEDFKKMAEEQMGKARDN
jgi:gas vesicle protein